MSGGIAFVLDPEGQFPERCNQEIVDLEDPTDEDFAEVRGLIEEHMQRTGSTVAQRTLDRWDSLRGAWVKVMPKDYKRALREMAERQAKEAGEPDLVAERSDSPGEGPADDGHAPYMPGAGNQEKSDAAGVPGQYEDAAAAAQRAEQDGQPEQAEGEAGERVLPSHG
jgi:hypothetical protein